jgi:hypothetical protein
VIGRAKLTGEEMHGAQRLAEFQRAKKAYDLAQMVLGHAQQIEAEAKSAYEQAGRQLRRVAES